jgi:hypothetical protein
MARQQFEQVVAQASKVQFKRLTLSDNTPVSPSGKVTLDIFGSQGAITMIKSMYFFVDRPPSSTTGQHQLEILNNQGAGTYLTGVSNYGDSLQWHFSRWNSATKDKAPLNEDAALIALNNIVFDDVVSLRLEYYNFTDKTQTNERDWIFNVLETQVRK